MIEKLVDWVLQRRAAVIVMSVLFAPTITLFSSAVMGLQWVWRGPGIAIGDALLACLSAAVLAMAVLGGPANAMPLAVSWCLPIVSGCIVGAILRATGGLRLSTQVLLLLAFGGVALYSLLGPAPGGVSDTDLAQLLAAMGLDGVSAQTVRPRLVGFFGLTIGMELIAALFLVSWLVGIARRKREFAREYRSITMGYVLGVPFALVVIGALLSDSMLLHNLFGIAGLAWLLRGLVFFHSRVHANGAHPVVYVPVYVIGVMFGFSLLIQGIFGEGLIEWE